MTDLLDRAIERARALPLEAQDELARLILQMAGEEPPLYVLLPEEKADLAQAELEVERGDVATEEEVQVLWGILRS